MNTGAPPGTPAETHTSAFAGDSPPDVSYIVDSFFPNSLRPAPLVDLSSLEGADLERVGALRSHDLESRHPGRQSLRPTVPAIGNLARLEQGTFQRGRARSRDTSQDLGRVREFAKQLTKSDGSQWGYSIMDNTTGEMLNFRAGADCQLRWRTIERRRYRVGREHPEHVEGLQIQVAMIQEDKTAPPLGTFVGHEVDTAFLDGRIAMQLSYASFLTPP